MPDASPRKENSYHHGDLKQALLDETALILREEGEAALSLRTLANRLGVSRTAPYNHFENKEALLCAVAEEGFKRFEKAMRTARRRQRNEGGYEMMRATVRAYLNFALKNREYYDLMYSGKSWGESGPTKSLAATARHTLRTDIERLQRAQDRGQIRKDLDVADFGKIFWGTLHGISRLSLDGVYSDPGSLKRLCDRAADMLWAQMAP